jgi:hypothetical protein
MQTTIKYENGQYLGDLKEQKRHGQGRFFWASGNKYVGTWVDDVIQGEGSYSWFGGSNY